MRSIEDIQTTGAAWVTEAELAMLCAFAKRAEQSEAEVEDFRRLELKAQREKVLALAEVQRLRAVGDRLAEAAEMFPVELGDLVAEWDALRKNHNIDARDQIRLCEERDELRAKLARLRAALKDLMASDLDPEEWVRAKQRARAALRGDEYEGSSDDYRTQARAFFAAHRDLIMFTTHLSAEAVAVDLLADLLRKAALRGGEK